jgi:hypothetical protein
VSPVPLPYIHWFESIVNADVWLVNIIIVFDVELYIPLVPLKLISGFVIVLYENDIVGV